MVPSVSVTTPKLVLCDIEGTTTSITFVKDVLFPYARQKLTQYLRATWKSDKTREDVELLRQQFVKDRQSESDLSELPSFTYSENATDSTIDSVAKYVLWQMDRDRKTTSLKQLQGHIWTGGYEAGEIKAHVYEEVPQKFEEWTHNGIRIAIYSSGSVLAQKLLFSYTQHGDLTKYISHYFDTTIGAKQEAESYRKIVASVALSPSDILFLTDVSKEARAALEAGMQSILLWRDGVLLTDQDTHEFSYVNDFNQIIFE